MQTNLTWLDVLGSLLLGVIGSLIAAYLFKHSPPWFTKASTLWAERSKASAVAQVEKLTLELRFISELQTNTTLLVGWSSAMLARLIVYVALSLSMVVATVGLGVSVLVEQALSIAHPFEPKLTAQWITPAFLAGAGFVFARGFWIGLWLLAYSNLEARKTLLDLQIVKLCERWSL